MAKKEEMSTAAKAKAARAKASGKVEIKPIKKEGLFSGKSLLKQDIPGKQMFWLMLKNLLQLRPNRFIWQDQIWFQKHLLRR
jgi:hypothetical protein